MTSTQKRISCLKGLPMNIEANEMTEQELAEATTVLKNMLSARFLSVTNRDGKSHTYFGPLIGELSDSIKTCLQHIAFLNEKLAKQEALERRIRELRNDDVRCVADHLGRDLCYIDLDAFDAALAKQEGP